MLNRDVMRKSCSEKLTLILTLEISRMQKYDITDREGRVEKENPLGGRGGGLFYGEENFSGKILNPYTSTAPHKILR